MTGGPARDTLTFDQSKIPAGQVALYWRVVAKDAAGSSATLTLPAAGKKDDKDKGKAAPKYAYEDINYITPANGIVVQYRATQGWSANQATQVTGTTPVYLRVGCAGGTFVTHTSSNGTNMDRLRNT